MSSSFQSMLSKAPSFGSSPSNSSSLSCSRRTSLATGSFSSSTGNDAISCDMLSGRSFVEMIQAHESYKLLLRSPTHYEIKLVHGTTTNLHWYVLTKMKDSGLPYITFEITTTNMKNLIQTVRSVSPGGTWGHILLQNPQDIGTYEGTLYDICCLADEVVTDMATYHLMSNNCQDFCNKLLIKMKIMDAPFPTTFHMDGTKPDHERSTFDCFSVVLHKVYDVALKKAPEMVAAVGAAVIGGIVDAPSHEYDRNQLLNNLIPISKLLRSHGLASKWREIGTNLSISGEVLSKIETENGGLQHQCLREMLREHLLQVHSYETLADVVGEYKESLSVKIRNFKTYGQLTIN